MAHGYQQRNVESVELEDYSDVGHDEWNPYDATEDIDFQLTSGIDDRLASHFEWDFEHFTSNFKDINWNFKKQVPAESTVIWKFQPQSGHVKPFKIQFKKQCNDSHINWNFPKRVPPNSTVSWTFVPKLPQNTTVNWNFQPKSHTGPHGTINWNFKSQSDAIDPVHWNFIKKTPENGTINWNFKNVTPEQSTINWKFEKRIQTADGVKWKFVKQTPPHSTVRWKFQNHGNIQTGIKWNFPHVTPERGSVNWNFSKQTNPSGNVKWNFLPALPKDRIGSNFNWDFQRCLQYDHVTVPWNFPSMTSNIKPIKWQMKKMTKEVDMSHEQMMNENERFKKAYAENYHKPHKQGQGGRLMDRSLTLTGRQRSLEELLQDEAPRPKSVGYAMALPQFVDRYDYSPDYYDDDD